MALMLAALVFAAGMVVGARSAKSPAQRAAEQAAPAPSVVTATVSSKVLSRTVTLRGEVRTQATLAVPLMTPPEGARPLVSSVHKKVGESATAGEVLLGVNGRPVFLIRGDAPAFRDLLPGKEGKDVLQAQQALVDLGFLDPTQLTGVFDAATQAAVEHLYTQAGFVALHTADRDPSEPGRLRAAVRAVRQAEAAAEAATSQPSITGKAPSGTRASVELADAREELSALEQTVGVIWPASELVVAPSVPVKVTKAPDSPGGLLGEQRVMEVASGQPLLSALVPPASAAHIAAGQKVTVTSDDGVAKLAGTVDTIGPLTVAGDAAPAPGKVPSGESGHPLTASLPPEALSWLGRKVRVDITTGSTSESVLVIPLSALRADPDGTPWVETLDASGGRQRLDVETGLSTSGEVEVKAKGAATLAAGVRVVVSG